MEILKIHRFICTFLMICLVRRVLCESFNFCYWLACKGMDLLLFAGFAVRMTSIKEPIGKHEDGA